jgi:threonine/homoserine/homoserine lactone efflux protein
MIRAIASTAYIEIMNMIRWKILFVGLGISLLGTLPLGTLNIAVMQISVSEGIWKAVLFSLGALSVEMVYVRLSLFAMDWVRHQKRLFRALEWVAVAIVLVLAVSSFLSISKPPGTRNLVLDSPIPKFLLGMALSAVNPLQIPFWFGWSTILFTKKLLLPQRVDYLIYVIGIGLGTFIGNGIFILGGRLIVEKLNRQMDWVNGILGGFFLLTALIMLVKLIRHRDGFERI